VRGAFAKLVLAANLVVAGFAQDSHLSPSTPIPMPVVPAQLLERPVPFRTGIGTAHDQVTTSSPEAQRYYDQGLAYLHDYVWIEAARSFHQAIRLDPNLALAYADLGDAYFELNQSAAAHRALEEARALSPRLSQHERRHLTIRERQLVAEDAPHDISKLVAYRKAIDEGLAEFPFDVELWLQRGVAESPDPADRGQGGTAASIRYYERALAIVPDHFAAHHYLTHAYENAGRIEDALRHGAAYAKLAADVPHARHMYGHDLRRVGRIQDAIAEFEAADRLETTYFAKEGVRPEYDWHYEHNLDLLATSYQYTGEVSKAEPLLARAFALPTANLVQAVNKREWPMFLRSRGRADEALAAAGSLIGHPNAVVQAIGHLEAGQARMMKGEFREAAQQANAALAAMKSAVAGSGLAALPLEELQGELLLRTGEAGKGRAMLDAMIVKARALPGPDEWAQALFTLESVARSARDASDWEFAGRVAQQMLEHDPAYAGTHYALALVAEHQGDRRLARAELLLAEKQWSRADPGFPELRDVRRRLGAGPSPR
jgi:tetratricopeptide (TPR) repeat protein